MTRTTIAGPIEADAAGVAIAEKLGIDPNLVRSVAIRHTAGELPILTLDLYCSTEMACELIREAGATVAEMKRTG